MSVRSTLLLVSALFCVSSAVAQERPLPREAEKILREKAAAIQAAKPANDRDVRKIPRRKGDITFDDLKFEMNNQAFNRNQLSKEIEKLQGTNITIRGYMHPSVVKNRGLKEFVLVRDNLECCFGPGAALYDCIMVTMDGTASADFSVLPIAVKGRFDVKEVMYPDGTGPVAIFRLDATEAK